MSADEKPANVTLWMPLYIQRHRAVASTLSHVEHSAFIYLSTLLWEQGGRVRDDDRWLARNLRLNGKQWAEARDAVLQNFEIGGGFVSDPEMIAEIERRKGVVEKRRAAGKASGRARSGQQVSNTCSTTAEHLGNDAPLSSNLYQDGPEVTVEEERPFRLLKAARP
jgi:uncharacterized protein YdaU (DUF1376 family)